MPNRARTYSEGEILAAALRQLDEGGAAALSVRGVAAAIGVAPNAIYTYFPTKAALVRALVDHLLADLSDPARSPAGGDHARGEVADLASRLREVLLAHPGAVPLLLASSFDGPNALTAGERLLTALERAGLPLADAARASYVVQTYVLGSVTLTAAELDPAAPRPDDATQTATRRTALAAIPAQRFPRTVAAADVIAAYNGAEQFSWGLDRLLNGLLGVTHGA